ncbi:DNA-binding LacI/PurR family transcriptional regulator [Rhizobium sp. BK529]|nr:DNA-binding LacI/PurR family transcriptional regulator [Rhizobium sp. BK529]
MNDTKATKKDRMRFVSAEPVAQLAGVSRSAVSRTHPGQALRRQRARKCCALSRSSATTSTISRGVLANQSRLVGCHQPEVGFRAHLAAALAKLLIQRGSIPILIDTGQTEDELLLAQKMLIGRRAEAIAISPADRPQVPSSSRSATVSRHRHRLFRTGRQSCACRNSEASRKAATVFFEAGPRRLAVAGSNTGTPSMIERESAFLPIAEGLDAEVFTRSPSGFGLRERMTAGRAPFSKTVRRTSERLPPRRRHTLPRQPVPCKETRHRSCRGFRH